MKKTRKGTQPDGKSTDGSACRSSLIQLTATPEKQRRILITITNLGVEINEY